MALSAQCFLVLSLMLLSEPLHAWLHHARATNGKHSDVGYRSRIDRSTVALAQRDEDDESDRSRPDPTKLGFDSRNDKKPNQAFLEPSVLSRFTSPKVDDPFLPLSDVLVAQIVAPGFQILWLSLNHAPSPSWIRPFFGYSGPGSLLAPTLVHGAALATCFVVGALAARAYEVDAIVPQKTKKEKWDYTKVIARVLQSGAFATGVLILGTQFDLYIHFGYVQLGDSPETDFRLQVAIVELTNDIVFEAICLLAWRLYLAKQSEG